MKDFDFSGLSVDELQQIKERIGKEIELKLDQDKKVRITKIMDCIKNYVESYGELRIGHDYDESIIIDDETFYEFLPYDDMIYLKW